MRASDLVARLAELIEQRGDRPVRLYVPGPAEYPLVAAVDLDKFDDAEGLVFCIEGAAS